MSSVKGRNGFKHFEADRANHGVWSEENSKIAGNDSRKPPPAVTDEPGPAEYKTRPSHLGTLICARRRQTLTETLASNDPSAELRLLLFLSRMTALRIPDILSSISQFHSAVHPNTAEAAQASEEWLSRWVMVGSFCG